MAEPETVELSETSPSVQTHLGILQSVITRMASNSTSSKTWCITLVSAILVIVADRGKPQFAYLALIPTLLFFALDAYYLALEKGFRNAYNHFVKTLHEGKLTAEDLYSVKSRGSSTQLLLEAIRSFFVWGFYVVLVIMTFIACHVVFG